MKIPDTAEPARFTERTVGALMTRDVAATTPDARLDALAHVFVVRNIGGIPVVDEAGRPVGIVTKTDIVRAWAHGRLNSDRPEDGFDVSIPGTAPAVLVRDVMAPVVVLREGDAIEHAAEMFVAKGVHRAPVVGAHGELIGILSAFDLLRGM